MATIVRTLVVNKTITSKQRVAIVLTKMDYVITCPHKERTLTDFKDLISRLSKLFPAGIDITDFQIASRSSNLNIPHHFGVIELLQHCLKPRRLDKDVLDPIEEPERYFLKFTQHPVETP